MQGQGAHEPHTGTMTIVRDYISLYLYLYLSISLDYAPELRGERQRKNKYLCTTLQEPVILTFSVFYPLQLDFLCNMNHVNALGNNMLMTLAPLNSFIYHCITTLTVYVGSCIFLLSVDKSNNKVCQYIILYKQPILSQ